MKAYIRKPNFVEIRRNLAVVDDDGTLIDGVTEVSGRAWGFIYTREYLDDDRNEIVAEEVSVQAGAVIEVPIDGYLPGEEGFDPNWTDKRKPGAPDIETVRDQSLDRLKSDIVSRATKRVPELMCEGQPPWDTDAPLRAALFKASWERMVLLACVTAGWDEEVGVALWRAASEMEGFEQWCATAKVDGR